MTEEALNKCTVGAPEFIKYVPSIEMTSSKLYRIMPPYFGSPKYKDSLVKVLFAATYIKFGDNFPLFKP
jgi:hypothetical protein